MSVSCSVHTYDSYVVRQNVETIQQADVVVLLSPHGNAEIAKFNSKIIEENYEPSDLIIVEDSADKNEDELILEGLSLDPLRTFHFAGWMDPSYYSRDQALVNFNKRVAKAAKQLMSPQRCNEEELQKAWELMKKVEILAYQNHSDERSVNKIFKDWINLSLDTQAKYSFPHHQVSLIKTFKNNLHKRRVFAVMGPHHGDIDHPHRFLEEAKKLFNFLNENTHFLIVDFNKNF